MRAVGIALAALLASSLVACVSRTPARSTAVDGEAEARRLATTAQAHFDLGEYTAAVADLRAAYRHHPTSGLLYNLGQAHRLAGDCLDATTTYRAYLRLAPRAPYRRTVEQHLAALRTCAVEQSVSAPVRGDGRGRRIAGVAAGLGGVLMLAGGAWIRADGMASDTASTALMCAGSAAIGTGATLYVGTWRF